MALIHLMMIDDARAKKKNLFTHMLTRRIIKNKTFVSDHVINKSITLEGNLLTYFNYLYAWMQIKLVILVTSKLITCKTHMFQYLSTFFRDCK